MKTKIIFIALVTLLGFVACKKNEEVKPKIVKEYVQEPLYKADSMYYQLLYFDYKYIGDPNINGHNLPSYDVMFDQDLKGGEFILKKGYRPYKLILMLDTANYEVLSISDTSINLNDGLYIKR